MSNAVGSHRDRDNLHGLDGVSTAHGASSLSFRRPLDPGPEHARPGELFAFLKYADLPSALSKNDTHVILR